MQSTGTTAAFGNADKDADNEEEDEEEEEEELDLGTSFFPFGMPVRVETPASQPLLGEAGHIALEGSSDAISGETNSAYSGSVPSHSLHAFHRMMEG